MGVRREEALADEGTVLSLLFKHRAARFHFTVAQRRVLEAQQHRTDAEIAEACGVSLSAVKKVWVSSSSAPVSW